MKRQGIVPKDTRYVPLVQQPFCCVPTCIQIVMLRHNLPLVPAEAMARHLHVVVPKDDAKNFWNARTQNKRPEFGWGTVVNEDKTVNPMLKKLGIPLRLTWKLIDDFADAAALKRYLYDAVKEDRDVLVCFDYAPLFDSKSHGGHICVLDRVYPRKGEVRLVDPEADVPKWRTVKIDKLFTAMQSHVADKMGGCWELRSTRKKAK